MSKTARRPRAGVRGPTAAPFTCLAVLTSACGGATQSGPPPSETHQMFAYKKPSETAGGEVPGWMGGSVMEQDKICGFGVAGAGYDEHSPYPKQFAQDRAAENLAGILGTRVQEAIIDKATARGTALRQAKAITVDAELVANVRELAQTEFWLDRGGQGPFAAKNFTYARSCLDAASAAGALKVDQSVFKDKKPSGLASPGRVPPWVENYGVQPDGRLCAVGFSLPTFHADQTFDKVIKDVRWQLAEVIQTFVSSYYEELATTRASAFEAMTLATTEAISKGAVVTEYWYDRDGIGPLSKRRSTYGFGCVYPVQILQASAAQAAAKAPEEEKQVLAQVQQRAADAFDALDAEISRQHKAAGTRAPDDDGSEGDEPGVEAPPDPHAPPPPTEDDEDDPAG